MFFIVLNIETFIIKESINPTLFICEFQTRFRIIDKKTGQEVNPEIKYEADPLMVFHHINAYEENGENVFFFYVICLI
jgi:carotenoid cleavage dioxygenase-like enzyme